ncbi:MAG TPA: PilZ domain-containing protein [Candidatus Competibacter sp.]|nr:hypothetical protein [Candidatus Competibacteraceae bacterium]HRC73593.1 PilZ domain-containing protein [Candidatus Competibacter sp.]
MSAPPAGPEKREFYRLGFPPPERPLLRLGRQRHEVLDCSVRGLRFTVSQQPAPVLGTIVEGQLLFRRNAQTAVRGLVIRVQNGEIALHMPDSEIPSAILRSEERHLLSHYRTWAKLRLWPPLEPGL